MTQGTINIGAVGRRGSVGYDGLARSLMGVRDVLSVIEVVPGGTGPDAHRGAAVIVGYVLERDDLAWIAALRKAGDHVPVVAICRSLLGSLALEAGANGIVNLTDARDDLESAIHACAGGGSWHPGLAPAR